MYLRYLIVLILVVEWRGCEFSWPWRTDCIALGCSAWSYTGYWHFAAEWSPPRGCWHSRLSGISPHHFHVSSLIYKFRIYTFASGFLCKLLSCVTSYWDARPGKSAPAIVMPQNPYRSPVATYKVQTNQVFCVWKKALLSMNLVSPNFEKELNTQPHKSNMSLPFASKGGMELLIFYPFLLIDRIVNNILFPFH